MTSRSYLTTLVGLVAAVAADLLSVPAASASQTSVSALSGKTHFHGLAVDRADPSRLLLATHHGLFAVMPDGRARRISDVRDDFMGFTPHPTDAGTLYASGHPSSGGNLGIIASTNGGKTWKRISEGVRGPVDFHQMDVSGAEPRVIYGVHGGLQVSRDGGRSWELVGPAPEGLIDLAASAKQTDTLFAATRAGLFKSADGGRTWQLAYLLRRPVTMVHTASEGVYAFVVGTGLIHADEADLTWRAVGADFGTAYVLHFAADPTDAAKLYAVTFDPQTRRQAIRASRDSGKSWSGLGD